MFSCLISHTLLLLLSVLPTARTPRQPQWGDACVCAYAYKEHLYCPKPAIIVTKSHRHRPKELYCVPVLSATGMGYHYTKACIDDRYMLDIVVLVIDNTGGDTSKVCGFPDSMYM